MSRSTKEWSRLIRRERDKAFWAMVSFIGFMIIVVIGGVLWLVSR